MLIVKKLLEKILIRLTDFINITRSGTATIFSGQVRVEGHGTQIGFTNSGSGSKSISSGTSFVSLSDSITISPGTYVLIGHAIFPAGSSTGVRALQWYSVTGATATNNSSVAQYATTGFTGRVQTVEIVNISSSTAYRLNCFQSTGRAVEVEYTWRLVRIA